MKTLNDDIITVCQQAKSASITLSLLSDQQKNNALIAMAEQLEKHKMTIVKENQQDVERAKQQKAEAAFIDRLTLNDERITTMIDGLKKIATLADPVGEVLASWQVDSGLTISRISIPLGVIAIIYESRPNVTADAAALCLKSGNAVILRGGSECAASNKIISQCLQKGLEISGINPNAIQYMPTQDREAVNILLTQNQYIDVLIPRGGKKLIAHLVEHSKIPLLHHLDGICHTYVHSDAELNMTLDIVKNAKLRRTGICGATETLLVDQAIAHTLLPRIVEMLLTEHCEIHGDETVQKINSKVIAATEADWSTEYLAAIIAIKVVDNIDAAIAHIAQYGSNHTEAIITANTQAAEKFLNQVNSAIVMHNCSTQFADGGEFGMGAEMGIATGKLHARGPVGIKQLTTFKYKVEGNGQTRP